MRSGIRQHRTPLNRWLAPSLIPRSNPSIETVERHLLQIHEGAARCNRKRFGPVGSEWGQYTNGVSVPSVPMSMTGWVCHDCWSPPMPGESAGIPGSASPAASGRSASSVRIASTGTCPSIAYPLTIAVWHDMAFRGTPRSAAVWRRPGSSTTVAAAPFSCRYTTHPVQQPQPGSRNTSKVMPVRSVAWLEGCTIASLPAMPACGCEEPPQPAATATTSARAGIVADLFIHACYDSESHMKRRVRLEKACITSANVNIIDG